MTRRINMPMPRQTMTRMNVLIDPPLRQAMDRFCAENPFHISLLVRESVTQYLTKAGYLGGENEVRRLERRDSRFPEDRC